MDLLFKRYASPYLIVDEMIVMCQFSKFVESLVEFDEDDKKWEYYIHRVVDGQSFKDWKESIYSHDKSVSANDIETTVKDSLGILNGFNPY